MEELKNNLNSLLKTTSKHSHYQLINESLIPFVDGNNLNIKSRHEKERLNYILEHIQANGLSVLEIGGNTGYFSFELLQKGVKYIDFFEGNNSHSQFVREASRLLNIENRITVFNEYFQFDRNFLRKKYDVTILLNVIHHLGDDFDQSEISISQAKEKMLFSLNSLAHYSTLIVFQMGFCWKGDVNQALFKNGTKKEMINYIQNGTLKYWEIINIGIPELINGKVRYTEIDDRNIKRNDKLGEFLNRPIFIMKSKLV